jgi:hypothetical protein
MLEERNMKKFAVVVGGLALVALQSGCADTRQTRTELDFGTSHKLAVFNQTYNPEAEKNLEPVVGLDSGAATGVVEKYVKSFGSAQRPTTYTINIGK